MSLFDQSKDDSSVTANKKEKKNFIYTNIMVLLMVLNKWAL